MISICLQFMLTAKKLTYVNSWKVLHNALFFLGNAWTKMYLYRHFNVRSQPVRIFRQSQLLLITDDNLVKMSLVGVAH